MRNQSERDSLRPRAAPARALFSALLLAAALSLAACADAPSGSSDSPAETQSEENAEGLDPDGAYFSLTNGTGGALDLYADAARTALVRSVAAGETDVFEALLADDDNVYYLTYHVDIGIDVPWHSSGAAAADSCLVLRSERGKTVRAAVCYPDTMSVSEAYIVLENRSGGAVEMRRGSSVLTPESASSVTLNGGDSGVYKIEKTNFGNLSSFKVAETAGGAEFPLPAALDALLSGTIYTTAFDGKRLSLVSVTPFSADTRKKIWRRKNSASAGEFFWTQVFRARHDAADGSVVLGQSQKSASSEGGAGRILLLDEYGATVKSAKITVTSSERGEAVSYIFRDALEASSGDFVFLLDVTYADGSAEQMILCYDGEISVCRWRYTFTDTMCFRQDSRGKLIETENGTYAVCGGKYTRDADGLTDGMAYWVGEFTCGADGGVTLKEWTGSSPVSGAAEQMVCSAAWDAGAGRLICAGYDNFTGEYPGAHRGVIFALDADFSAAETLYARGGTLFFGAACGDDGGWYACGEYADSANALHGCVVTDGTESGAEPSVYSTDGAHCWFNQIAAEERRIVLSGQSGASADGADSVPWVLAADRDGLTLWENFYGGSDGAAYNAVYCCMANGIGSFLMELYGAESRKSEIVSTDLLGRNTGGLLDALTY